MIAAFGGWNDAGAAATQALEHLISLWPTILIGQIDPEDYYDFQVNRPLVSMDQNNVRTITWPSTDVLALQTPQFPFDLVIVRGLEPSMRWKDFATSIMDLADDLDITMLITIGSLLADTPHSRPISISRNAGTPEISRRLNLEMSSYEGSTGILGILQDLAIRRGIDAISLWASIPHYASASPSPKAILAMINTLEDILEIPLPIGDLLNQSRDWEESVNELAEEDSEVGDYVRQLEASKDAEGLPEATGDSIAKEFERYFRRGTTE